MGEQLINKLIYLSPWKQEEPETPKPEWPGTSTRNKSLPTSICPGNAITLTELSHPRTDPPSRSTSATSRTTAPSTSPSPTLSPSAAMSASPARATSPSRRSCTRESLSDSICSSYPFYHLFPDCCPKNTPSHSYFSTDIIVYTNKRSLQIQADMNNDKKTAASKKQKVAQNDKYYKVAADFNYLKAYNYKVTKEIGRGGYGVVYKATDMGNKDAQCAIKINFNTVSRELIYAEMAYLEIVKGKSNLPKLVNLFVHEQIAHIVIEYFKFKPFITYFNTFSLEDIKHYLIELLIGLKNLKDLGIYHRDIKPGNFLYNPDTKKGMIIDFGLAELDPEFMAALEAKMKELKQLGSPEFKKNEQTYKIYKRLMECLKIIGRNKIGTETYMPIESILHHQVQSYNSDMWPVGVILLQFVVRKYNIFNNVRMINKPTGVRNTYFINYIIQLATFYGDKIYDQCKLLGYELKLPKQIEKLSFRDVASIDGFDDVVQNLLERMLDLNAETRITVEDAIKHEFFNSVREQHIVPQNTNGILNL